MATLHRIRERLKRTASLLPVMPRHRPMYRGNPAITVLRIFLWLMPALFIPLLVLLGSILSRFLPGPANISLMLVLFVAATGGIGFFEESLRFQQIRISQTPPEREWVSSSFIFVLQQFVIAPTLCFATMIGLSIAASWWLP